MAAGRLIAKMLFMALWLAGNCNIVTGDTLKFLLAAEI